MADFEACYFCGSVPEGSLREFAVVPRALDPDPDEQASVVLCPTCREKLTALMEPVVAAATGERDGPASTLDERAADPVDGETDVPAADRTATGSGDADEPSGEGVTFGDAGPAGREDATEPTDSGSPRPESSDGPSSAGDDAGRRDPYEAAHDDIVGDDSETYSKVLRLLKNREFPVQRAEIEEVAASAYELDPRAVSSAVDTMVQKGLLVDDGGTLRRG